VPEAPAVQRLGGPAPSAPLLAGRPDLPTVPDAPGPVAAQAIPDQPAQPSTVEPPVVARLLGDRPVPERLPRGGGGGPHPAPAPAVPVPTFAAAVASSGAGA